MDFRAMLKKRRYQKWAREEQEQEKVDLKEVEKPMPALKKVEKVRVYLLYAYIVIRFMITWFDTSNIEFLYFFFFFFFLYVLTELVYFYYGMHDELLYDSLQVCCTSFVFSIVFVKCRITARYATWMVSFNIENIALIKK